MTCGVSAEHHRHRLKTAKAAGRRFAAAVDTPAAPGPDPGQHPSGSNPRERNGRLREEIAVAQLERLRLLVQPGIRVHDGAAKRETIGSFLDGGREALLRHLRVERIHLS